MTALNGTLANSRNGCAILEAGLAKLLRNYQGMVSAGQLGRLLSLGTRLASAVGGTCPVATIFRSFLEPSGTTTSVSTFASAVTASEGTAAEASSTQYRIFRDESMGNFPVVY